MEGPLRDFNRKQKKINGREKNATEFPVLPQFHLYMFDRLKGITNSLIHIEVWLTCSHVCFQISHLPFSGKFCLLSQERHLRKRPLHFLHQGVSPKKYVKVTGLAVIMQFVPVWMGFLLLKVTDAPRAATAAVTLASLC